MLYNIVTASTNFNNGDNPGINIYYKICIVRHDRSGFYFKFAVFLLKIISRYWYSTKIEHNYFHELAYLCNEIIKYKYA